MVLCGAGPEQRLATDCTIRGSNQDKEPSTDEVQSTKEHKKKIPVEAKFKGEVLDPTM
jgi:hypothetical protein